MCMLVYVTPDASATVCVESAANTPARCGPAGARCGAHAPSSRKETRVEQRIMEELASPSLENLPRRALPRRDRAVHGAGACRTVGRFARVPDGVLNGPREPGRHAIATH